MNAAQKFMDRLKSMFDEASDERGAEGTEYILLAVMIVVGVAAVYGFIRDRLKDKGTQIGNCINNASTATTC